MSVLYLATSPPPAVEGSDAVFQEIELLRSAFGGEIVNLFPLARPSRRVPLPLFGATKLRPLRKAEAACRLNHIFFSIPYVFPVLHFAWKPIVYTVTASVAEGERSKHAERLARLKRIVVASPRDARILDSWGLNNVSVVPPAVEARIEPCPRPALDGTFTLLMASAPWVSEQFVSKGVDVLLKAAAALPYLRLILLWRGVLLAELKTRVAALGVGERVEIADGPVAVGDYLARAHAAVLLATESDVVKAYPHSLLEALIADRPVIVSETIAMADYVRERDCGVVVERVGLPEVIAAIVALKVRYETLRSPLVAPDAFSPQRLIDAYREIYES